MNWEAALDKAMEIWAVLSQQPAVTDTLCTEKL